ncbi:MAG: hypothetical protein ACSHXI_19830 [Hoeflea sp.]|uniref:hypothetical protein n=1 Tax=Hoeflea sp. TaxID=1940281 RepID=UPI003EF3991D
MLNTSLFTVAAISVVSAFAQVPAYASDLSNIVRDVRDHRTSVQFTVRDHRTAKQQKVRDHRVTKQEKIRDHRTPRKNEVVNVSRKDCRTGAESLRRSGYRQIRMLDCQGTEYSYLAKKHHALFGARMNAFSGKIKVSFLGPVRSH